LAGLETKDKGKSLSECCKHDSTVSSQFIGWWAGPAGAGLGGWAGGLAAQGWAGWSGPGLGGAKQKAKDKSQSAIGTVQIFKLFFNLLTFLTLWLTPIPKFIVKQFLRLNTGKQ
jgi:hypothetical protein